MCLQAVAIDIGTSGIRAQLLDIDTGKVLRTRVTTRNPVPGANVMDHMSFAIQYGEDLAHSIVADACRQLIAALGPDDLVRVAVCGNPIQLSLFEGISIKDLAYAGDNMIDGHGIQRLDRKGHIVKGGFLGYPDADVIIPPAIRHEIGADALAMMVKSGFLEDDYCMVTDYGTNAEMALKIGDEIYTGSAAAGPAMEGQQIKCGMLAGPGAISDLVRTPSGWQTKVLNKEMFTEDGPMVNLRSNISRSAGASPQGITGTGVVATVYALQQDGQITDEGMANDPISFTRSIKFSLADYREAGKAIGAIRAGHLTLMLLAKVDPKKIKTMYMAGASGTYVDPVKAQKTGLIIPHCTLAKQVGNTSLELAKDLALDPSYLDELNVLRTKLLTNHTMFASCDVFRDLYTYEYGYWAENMPLTRYRRALERYGVDGYLDPGSEPTVDRLYERDIRDIGESLEALDLSPVMTASWECSRCGKCIRECPERALAMENGKFIIRTGYCLGTACQRCQENCPDKKYRYSDFAF
ncbi:MAG: methylamine methyltransferase corrinoid protein reductive activase [Candidatus Methanomethylophilus sp.]|nr:methylamine methyltransferase corrinoid protein reductive activase [Methanomethylophilus sp.]